MKRVGALLASAMIALLVLTGSPVGAVSLKIAPLRYETTLTQGEKQKGYVDISNPNSEPIMLKFSVQAFRQINDEGGIEFYDSKSVSSGILLDLESTDLGPREVLRLYFLIDSTKLPAGEVFAAILAHTVPDDNVGTAQAIRVGTILEITNGQAGAYRAAITSFSTPFLQIGETITARFVVKNEDEVGLKGYRPSITFGVRPYSSQDVQGPLVFAGRSRTVEYKTTGNYFGFVWLQASVDGSSKGALAFVMTGYWRWLGPSILVAMITLIIVLRSRLHKKH